MASYTNFLNTKLILLLLYFINNSNASNCKGCVQLDTYSFDKIVSKFDASLVKFDVAYPYGEKQEEFAKVSESVRDIPQLLIAEIGVKDYGEKDNTDLADKYGASKDNFPVVVLFRPDLQPITFSGAFNADNIINFIRLNSKVYVGLPGCLEEFDKLSGKFMKANLEEKKKILRQTEDAWDKVKGARSQKSAEIYVKTMRKTIEKDDFVNNEVKRIENVLKGKISKEKTAEMQLRLNVLKSFSLVSLSTKKEEL